MMTRKMMIEQRKTLLYAAGGYLGICAVLGLWGGFFGSTPDPGLPIYIMVSMFACALVASKLGFDLVNKEGRTAMIMTPATAADKFVPRLIAVLPAMLILVIIGYPVFCYADILALGVSYGQWVSFTIPHIFNIFNGPDAVLGVCILLSMFLFSESIFIFGAVAWPRKSLLKSIGVFIAIQFLLSLLTMAFIKSNSYLYIDIVDETAFGWSVTAIITAIAIGIIYCAYLKFKRIQVI